MEWLAGFHVPFDDPAWWFWLGWSFVPDVVMFACIAWLWRSLARTRREARQRSIQADEAIARRTETLRWATELADVGVWFWDLPTGVVEWTDRAKAQFALPADRVPSLEYFFSVVHPEDRDRVRAAIDRSLADRQDYRTVFRTVHPDGSQHWIAAMGRALFDVHGEPSSMGGVTLDVTQLRKIEGDLLALQVFSQDQTVELQLARRLRAALEGMLDPLAIVEPVRDDERRVVDFTYLDVNPAACAWLRTDRDHLVGKRVCESLPEIESSGLLRRLAELTDTGRPLVLDDFPFTLRGTDLRRLDVRGIRGDDWLSLVWRDVTERHDARERLAASEEQFRLLAENSTDVILRLDADDTILWISPSVTPVLGWKQVDGVGHDGKEFLATAETRDQFQRDKARVMAGQGAVSRAQVRAATGDVHWMEVHSFPYRTPEGIVSGMVSSLHVVDAEVRMSQDLERRARMDELTGLLGRRELLERLAAVVAGREQAVGLVWCDIDGFKAINDTHGHAAGDAVLEALGARIRGCLRSSDDMGGRIGGDELVVVLRGIGGLDEAAAFAENLRRRAAEPIPVGDAMIRATISVGVTLAGPEEGVDALLARADDAMYQAKDHGKNRAVAIPAPVAVLAAGR